MKTERAGGNRWITKQSTWAVCWLSERFFWRTGRAGKRTYNLASSRKCTKNSVLSNGALQLSIFQARRLSRWVRLPKTIPLKPPTECRLRGFKVWGHGTPRLLNQQRPSMLMPPAESHFDRWKLNSITRPRNVCQRLDDPYTMPPTLHLKPLQMLGIPLHPALPPTPSTVEKD